MPAFNHEMLMRMTHQAVLRGHTPSIRPLPPNVLQELVDRNRPIPRVAIRVLAQRPSDDVREIAAGLELFGHERGHILLRRENANLVLPRTKLRTETTTIRGGQR